MGALQLEVGRNVRWRGLRWKVLSLQEGGFVRLAGMDAANRDLEVEPLLPLEQDALELDVLPVPEFKPEVTDRARWRAMHQAILTSATGGREQLVGLDWGAVAVEPYQLVPLMRVARSVRPRLLIADDTGLGKTAEAGIVLRYLAQRHRAARVLIVTRASPEPERWQREMWTKFGFDFDILKSGADFLRRRRGSPTVNVFAQQPRLIVSMSLAARQILLDELRKCPVPFDAVIIDEAHHVADRGSRTKRLTTLARVLAQKVGEGALLLLTATPHDGKSESFLSLLRLLDPYVELGEGRVAADVASRLVVRRLKNEVTLSGGRRFIPRVLHVRSTIGDASPEERRLEGPLQAYLEWLRGEEQRYEAEQQRAKAKGCSFLATILMKRYGSTVAALRATLRRRLGLPPAEEDGDAVVPFVDSEASDPEDEVIDPTAGADHPPPPLAPQEADLARALLEAAEKVKPGRDSKLEHLVKLLRTDLAGRKVVVFTEYRDTLRAAARRLEAEGIRHVLFHGDTPPAEREEALQRFRSDPSVLVFLATDAGSEGQNLQHACHDLVHLDVPWNPNRYEQRNGRIDRYGQMEAPHIWALVAADRRKGEGRPEFRALQVVIEKLKTIEEELGSVGPILPGFSGGTVQDVLAHADEATEGTIEELMEDPSFRTAQGQLTRLSVRNRREIEAAEGYVARLGTTDDFRDRLEGLLTTAFRGWDDGGRLEPLGDGLLAVHVPRRLRRAVGREVISRATFRRDCAVAEGESDRPDPAEFLSPGHPLVQAVVAALRDEAADPAFPHRFDVGVSDDPALVLSFLVRFVDGEGWTVEERLEPVAVAPDGSVSTDPDSDLRRLGLEERGRSEAPDAAQVRGWKDRFPDLLPAARAEVERRAQARRVELLRIAHQLHEEEVEVLAVWKAEQEGRIDKETLGIAPQLSFEAVEAYRARMERLEREYEERLAALRRHAQIDLASVELIGGKVLVEPRP